MVKIVISQPMFLPWIGLFEQIRSADIYLHYDDVQFPQGRSLTNRVQIKTTQGSQWLTVPIIKKGKGLQLIKDALIDETQNWRDKHLKKLKFNYNRAPYFDVMFNLVERIYKNTTSLISEFNIFAIETIARFLGFSPLFEISSHISIQSTGSEHLLELVKRFKGNVYITGHGAQNYLDHDLFEKNSIRVEYMDYLRLPYPQLYGEFDPHVTILDLISNTGTGATRYICSPTKYWKDFIDG